MRMDRVDFTLGPDAHRSIRLLRQYYEIGQAFSDGARSMRDVSARFEARFISGTQPDQVPYSLASISRACRGARQFFGQRLSATSPEMSLFLNRGEGFEVAGLTALGWSVWRQTRDFLCDLGVISPVSDEGGGE